MAASRDAPTRRRGCTVRDRDGGGGVVAVSSDVEPWRKDDCTRRRERTQTQLRDDARTTRPQTAQPKVAHIGIVSPSPAIVHGNSQVASLGDIDDLVASELEFR